LRILIANRGEIARRIIRTAHGLGHQTIAVYADPDAESPFVAEATESFRLGPADLTQSYLSVDRLLTAASHTRADAVHPGYGFLSESAAFAAAVQDSGMIWIGPRPDAIAQMGSKIEARRLATAAGVPVIPGFDAEQTDDALATAAEKIGFPVLVKAAAGGGGKGIRIVNAANEFSAALAEARSEASRSFGDDAMIVERYIQQPRHVEVQILGDHHGHVVHLGTRECSVQRRYQKLLEEAPAPNLSHETRQSLETSAVALAQAIGYDSAGTVEFVVDHETGQHYFLEMNTRLQVEHPVTEAVTGIDLVAQQILVAQGMRLGFDQDAITFNGHALEARINAENPYQAFAPQTGTVTDLRVPPGVRWDSGIEQNSEVSPHYDSMVAKLIVHAATRDQARQDLISALEHLIIGGLTTNGGFHHWLCRTDAFRHAEVTTRFVDDVDIPDRIDSSIQAGCAWRLATDRRKADADQQSGAPAGPWQSLGSFRLTPHRPLGAMTLVGPEGEQHWLAATNTEATLAPDAHSLDYLDEDHNTHTLAVVVDNDERTVTVNHYGDCQTFHVPRRIDAWAPSTNDHQGDATAITAPFPAVVTEILVHATQVVTADEPVITIEAMKMLHTLRAAGTGTVDTVRVGVGEQVDSRQVLVTFEVENQNEKAEK